MSFCTHIRGGFCFYKSSFPAKYLKRKSKVFIYRITGRFGYAYTFIIITIHWVGLREKEYMADLLRGDDLDLLRLIGNTALAFYFWGLSVGKFEFRE